MQARLILLCSAVLIVAGISVARADNGMAMPKNLPPGMTPAVFKMVMTPGPQHPAGLPADVVPLGGCIPTMGYHYANPKDWPLGPIYGWYKGQVTFVEVMIAQSAFAKGASWNGVLKPLPGHRIDHVDIWFEPHGHPGYTIPHYDIHAWYIPAPQYMYFCGNTSGKKPAWL